MIQPVFIAVLGGFTAFLFTLSLASFFSLLRGSFYLRRFARAQIRDDRAMLLKSPLVPGVSLIATVADASQESRDYVRRLLEVHYGKHELVLVLDGLEEAETTVWKQEFRLAVSSRTAADALPTERIRCIYEPADPLRMVVVNKDPGGEADSRNAAINVADYPLIGIVERSSEFQPHAFLQLVRSMLEQPDQIVAVCGTAPPPHGSNLTARIGALESNRLWLARCGSLASRNMLGTVPGCCMLVKRDAAIEAGGFRAGNLELFLHLHMIGRAAKHSYRVALAPEPISYARPPASLGELRAAVWADQREIIGALRSRSFRTPSLPSLFTVRLMRPVVETLAYALAGVGLAFRWIQFDLVALVLLSTIGMGTLLSMAAVVFREQASLESSDPKRMWRLFFTAIPENFGYRQWRNLWLIAGFWKKPTAA